MVFELTGYATYGKEIYEGERKLTLMITAKSYLLEL
jgi:hypothetical protein